ncbi:unnamed protein product [Strongylus vulgaris]|uniref:Protein-serine/threonine kinase n=1 Tax=Strongylus vulgaris TaxID=40348 RepID=A0A3P7LJF2_STRVU|nr:unnamed protein product [Strongylus vulgaris]
MQLTRRALGPFVGAIAKKLEHYRTLFFGLSLIKSAEAQFLLKCWDKLFCSSQFQPSSLTIQQYLDFGRIGTAATSYTFLKNELMEFSLLPPKLLQMPSSKMVSSWYCESFEDLLKYENAVASVENVNA